MPVPPWLPSMLMMWNAPGPTLSRSSSVAWLKHGSGSHWSIGCMTSTANGAAHFGCAGGAASAVAWARTVTESSPKSFANTPGTALRAVTWIWSFATSFEEKVMSEPVTPPPFRFAYVTARLAAWPVLSGRAVAPARAAASALFCIWRCVRYHAPTSTTAAAIPRMTVMNTSVRIIAWPRLLLILILIPHAPWLCSRGGRTWR